MNTVTGPEAVSLRAYADTGEVTFTADEELRILLPIEYASASGKATCRLCEQKIAKGDRCIAFNFDPYGGRDRWGKQHRAYIHETCPSLDTEEKP